MKSVMLWSHRWLGIVLGLYFVLLGLSGSYLVYQEEIEHWMRPSLYISAGNISEPSWAQAVALAKTAAEKQEDPGRLSIPEDDHENIIVSFGPVRAYVDPAHAVVRGSENYRKTFSGQIFAFHHDLFWGRTGRTIMAATGILMVMILVSGLWVWWPRKPRPFWSAFKLGNIRGVLQAALDLHKLTGIYTLALLLMVTATGTILSRTDWFLWTGGGKPPEKVEEEKKPEPVDFVALQGKAKELGWWGRGLQIRIDAKGGTASIAADRGRLTLDLKTMERKEKPKEEKSFTQEFRAVNHDLHEGAFWGEVGRALVFFSGLLPLFFYVTGVYYWWARPRRRAA